MRSRRSRAARPSGRSRGPTAPFIPRFQNTFLAAGRRFGHINRHTTLDRLIEVGQGFLEGFALGCAARNRGRLGPEAALFDDFDFYGFGSRPRETYPGPASAQA